MQNTTESGGKGAEQKVKLNTVVKVISISYDDHEIKKWIHVAEDFQNIFAEGNFQQTLRQVWADLFLQKFQCFSCRSSAACIAKLVTGSQDGHSHRC